MSKEITEQEQKCLISMKEKFPDVKEITLLRFTKARNGDFKASSEMYENYVKWRSQYPNPMTLDGADKELKAGIWHFHGKTKDGHPCIIIKAARFFPQNCKPENLNKMALYAIEELFKHSPDEKVVAIVDYNGFGYANVSYETIKWLIHIYTDYFPEVLHIEFVINAPWIFTQLWNWNKTFLDERTQKKIHILPGNREEYLPILLEYFDLHNLPKWCGGSSKFSHKFRNASSDNPCVGVIMDRNDVDESGQDIVEDDEVEKVFVAPQMQPDEDVTACNQCYVVFGWFTRKHHCRSCGLIYCSKCCFTMVKLPPEYKMPDLQRVCIHCSDEFVH